MEATLSFSQYDFIILNKLDNEPAISLSCYLFISHYNFRKHLPLCVFSAQHNLCKRYRYRLHRTSGGQVSLRDIEIILLNDKKTLALYPCSSTSLKRLKKSNCKHR